jgi:hypothetical protein
VAAINVTIPLETEVIREHRDLVTGTSATPDDGIVIHLDVRRRNWRKALNLPRGAVVHWADVRTVDIKELSGLAWRMHYRLTYGDGWYTSKDGSRCHFALQPHLDGIDLVRQCTTVTLRAGVLLAVMAGIGLRAVSWLMLTLFHVEVSKSSLDRWIRQCAAVLPDAAGMAKSLQQLLPITECHFDEIFGKGQRPKKCMMVLRDEHGRIFAAKEVEERTEETVTAFLREVKSWGLKLVRFYVDGCEAYRAAIATVYPNATIQYDYFHVIQNIWKKLWRSVVARRKEIKADGERSETPAYSAKLLGLAKRIWKHRWLFFKREANMSDEEKAELQALLEADCHLTKVRGFVEAVWGVFEDSSSADEARMALLLLKTRPEVEPKTPFAKAVKFLESRFEDMIAFLKYPGVQRNSLAETGIRCLRRLERGHDGFRGAAGFDRYLRIYQAVKYCGWSVHGCASHLGLPSDKATGPPLSTVHSAAA